MYHYHRLNKTRLKTRQPKGYATQVRDEAHMNGYELFRHLAKQQTAS